MLRGYPRAGSRGGFRPLLAGLRPGSGRGAGNRAEQPTNRRSSPLTAIRSISGRRSRRNSPWRSRSFRAIPRRGSMRRRSRNRCRGLSQRWRGCARMRNAEILAEPRTGASPAFIGWLHHSCRRLCFWLITLLGAAPPPNHRASNGRSQKENFAIAAQYAAIASCAETGRLCRMPELRRAEASASPVRILRLL